MDYRKSCKHANMKRRLPPLSALRAFEAAARLGSMSIAADELGLTQGAISKQVMYLEQFLNKKLFTRQIRKITLTDVGARYASDLTRILDSLELSTREIESSYASDDNLVRFSCYYGFNIQWLLPRMPELRSIHPTLEVRLSSSVGEAIDFSRDAVDCAVRTGFGDWTGCEAEEIARIMWRPVCSPEFMRRSNLRCPEDLAQHQLLRSAGSPLIWERWLESNGVAQDILQSVLEFDQGALCYEAAIHGVGIAVADCMLVKRQVEAGKLVYPLEHTYIDPRSYYFLSRKGSSKSGLGQFRDWLTEQMRHDSPSNAP